MLQKYCFAICLTLLLSGCGSGDRTAQVAEIGATVMPFILDETTHIFEQLDNGGRQQVLADSGYADQVPLIQEHLQEEATRFASGDFHDPEAIHGDAMPGLHDLVMGHDRIVIEYSELPNGGQILYTSGDPELVGAIHQWFDAQVADHGAHAQAHR
jgi:hypothetical protein